MLKITNYSSLERLSGRKKPMKDLSLFGVGVDLENAKFISMFTLLEKFKISGRNIESVQGLETDLEVVKEITVNCKELSLLECTIGLNSSKLTIEDSDYVSFADAVKSRNNDIKLLIRIDDSPWCRSKVPIE